MYSDDLLSQGVDIQQNLKNEIRVNGKSLILRNVKKESVGNYSCVASNVEGDKESNLVELRVSCKYTFNISRLDICLNLTDIIEP